MAPVYEFSHNVLITFHNLCYRGQNVFFQIYDCEDSDFAELQIQFDAADDGSRFLVDGLEHLTVSNRKHFIRHYTQYLLLTKHRAQLDSLIQGLNHGGVSSLENVLKCCH